MFASKSVILAFRSNIKKIEKKKKKKKIKYKKLIK